METARSPTLRPLHWHNEVEISILEKGRITVLFGQRQYPRIPGSLVVLWGTAPHGILRATHVMVSRSIHIPLPWLLQWRLPSAIVDPILRGEMIQDRPRKTPCTDIALMRHWQALMDENTEAAREIVVLDIQRRLRLMAHTLTSTVTPPTSDSSDDVLEAFEKMAVVIAQRYDQPLKVQDVTAAAGLSASHGMRLFKRVAGMSIMGYLTQIRVSVAQRLLVTTDLKLAAVARQSGFNAVCQFYVAFRRLCGQTPRQYRCAMRALDHQRCATNNND
jgi:AraC-like DNA-binding protein